MLGLLLLVLGGSFLAAPLVLLHLVHHVLRPHLARPGIDYGVDLTLAAGEVAGDVADEVEPLLLAVYVEPHTRCQHADSRTDGGHHRHRQGRTDGLDRVAHTLRHPLTGQLRTDGGQLLIVHFPFPIVHFPFYIFHFTLSLVHFKRAERVAQADGESVELRTQGTPDLRPLLFYRESVVAGDHLVEPLEATAADVPQVARQLIGQRVAVAPGRFKAAVVHLPVLRDDVRKGDAVVVRRERRRTCGLRISLIPRLRISLIPWFRSSILLPRPVVLVCLLRACRYILFAPLLTLAQPLVFGLALLCRHGLRKQTIVQVRQVVLAAAGREYHPLQVLRACVHLHFQNRCHTHLVLQDSGARPPLANQVPTAAGASFQHPQAYLVLLLQDEVFDALRVLAVVAVHIVEEEAAYALASRYQPVRMTDVVSQLQQAGLCLLVAPARLAQVLQILLRVAQRHQFLAVLDGEGKLALALVVNPVNHSCGLYIMS